MLLLQNLCKRKFYKFNESSNNSLVRVGLLSSLLCSRQSFFLFRGNDLTSLIVHSVSGKEPSVYKRLII